MLQNAMVVAFAISELLRENQEEYSKPQFSENFIQIFFSFFFIDATHAIPLEQNYVGHFYVAIFAVLKLLLKQKPKKEK